MRRGEQVQETKNAIAIVMAKGYSQRFGKCKNTIDICDKPMLAYPIAAARNSRAFDSVIVSTDCQQVADIAMEHGADDVVIRDKGWDDYPTLEISAENSLDKYETLTDRESFKYCGILAGNSLFVRPSWFRAARTLIDFYDYKGCPINLVVPDKEFVSLGFFNTQRRRCYGNPYSFTLQHKGIIFDVDNPADLKIARQIQTAINAGHIDYSSPEDIHQWLIKDKQGFYSKHLTPKYKSVNPKKDYYNAASKWGNYDAAHLDYRE